MTNAIIVGRVNEYPTIRRLADVSQTTVGYHQHVLTHEAVTCLHEVDILRAELAAATKIIEANAAEMTAIINERNEARAELAVAQCEARDKATIIALRDAELAAATALLREGTPVAIGPGYVELRYPSDWIDRTNAAIGSK